MTTRYQWDDFVLDLDSYRLERAGVRLSLEPKAFNLLVLLIQRPGHLFTKQEIFDALWPDTAVTDHALTRVVAQLRRVLGDEAREARYVETVPTRGYRWIKDLDPPKRPHETGGAKADRSDTAVAANADHSAPRLVPGISAAFVLGLIALGFLAWSQGQLPAAADESRVVSRDPKWPVQVTTHSGLDMHPAMSPQGDAIAFVSDRSGAFEIYVRGLDGASGEVALTRDGAQNMQPAWSPDGRFIAYHTNTPGGIWVIPSRGGTPRQVSSIGARPAWSPDGMRIAFQTDELGDIAPNGYSAQVGSTIWTVNADGTQPRQLTKSVKPLGGHASPAWSHTGRFIAFAVFDAGEDNGVWMSSVESGETWPLELRASLYDPVFLADDSAVVVSGAEALIIRLPIDARTGKLNAPRELIPVAGVPGVRGLSLSPDGTRLAFAGLSLDSQIWSLDVSAEGLPKGEPRQLTRDTSRRNSLAVISPDGKKIAYMSIRRGELPNVWVMNADGSSPIQLTSDDSAEHKPTWFPDSARIGYLTKRSDVGGLWAVDINTRREQLVFDFAGAEHHPNLDGTVAEFQASPSMTQIALSMLTPPDGRRLMYVSPIDAFRPKQIGPPGIGYPAWSPDEQSIAVEIKDGSSTHAGVIDAATGTLRQLTKARGHTWVRSWSPDGRKVAVAAMRDGHWSVRSIDVATAKDTALTPPYQPGVYVRYPEWSPKGDRVLFERGATRGNIWTLAIK
ncbi:MAG TPA: winged helix-turn-helix domain-containing protein [Vicinamibacterales bacterium]|nr:winged helix-turn-helix domain-containing protein [Vicinamibacterales bacterium]